MSKQTSELISIAKKLPVEARAEIVDSLIESMQPTDKRIDGLWKAEIERRVASYESGEVKLVSGEDVFAKIHDRFAK
jgi:putative addiction module component (TIGR02574 family)